MKKLITEARQNNLKAIMQLGIIAFNNNQIGFAQYFFKQCSKKYPLAKKYLIEIRTKANEHYTRTI